MPKSKKTAANSNTRPKNKANIATQNKDTGIPSYNSDDTRPYEQKNTSAGFHKSGVASK